MLLIGTFTYPIFDHQSGSSIFPFLTSTLACLQGDGDVDKLKVFPCFSINGTFVCREFRSLQLYKINFLKNVHCTEINPKISIRKTRNKMNWDFLFTSSFNTGRTHK